MHAGRAYLHAEGALQAARHAHTPAFAEAIRLTTSASRARRMGSAVATSQHAAMGKSTMTPEQCAAWQRDLPRTLLDIARAKFACPLMRLALLATGDRPLRYMSRDRALGTGLLHARADDAEGPGRNLLGRALETVRAELRDPLRRGSDAAHARA